MHTPFAFISGVPGWVEIVLILVVVMLLFGAKRLPELARSLGRSMNEFKKGRAEGLPEEKKEETDQEATP